MAALTTTTPDLLVDFGGFASTQITVTAVTPRGKRKLAQAFGPGAVSFTLPKSMGETAEKFAETWELTIS